jgi:hypothetical protein
VRASASVSVLFLLAACGSSSGGGPDSGAPSPDAASPNDAGPGYDAIAIDSGGGPFHGGNPNGSCGAGVPSAGNPVDTSKVVGTGTPASCTFAALNAAVTAGGIITFDCGAAPATIAITATMNLPIDKDTVIDGGGLVTLDGQNAVEILRFDSSNYRATDTTVTLQHLAFVNAKTNPTQAIPTAPAPCSQGFDDGEGGAIFMRDGNLVVIDSIFMNDHAAPLGPDTGGGAIYIEGSKRGALVVKSTFQNDTGSNAAAIGGLNAALAVYDTLVDGNVATGHDANNDDPSKCSVINNGQNEIGSGGNGGGVYADGNDFDVTLCGDAITNNAAGTNAFGGGVFFTSDNWTGVLSIVDSTVTGNTGGHWTSVQTGSVTNAGTAVGTNAKSIVITNSTVQGVP